MDCIDILDKMAKLDDKKDIRKVIYYINKLEIVEPRISEKENNLTFQDLDLYLQKSKYLKIHDFINAFSFDKQKRFEPQESVFRLFAIKGILVLDNLKNAKMTFKNYGKGEIFNNALEPNYYKTNLKDSGDISDLTFIDDKNKKIIVVTSKNYNDYSGKGRKFDLSKIKLVYKDKYKNYHYDLVTIILVRDKIEVMRAIEKMTFSSNDSKKLVENSILIDWDDLNKSYRIYKYGYNIPLHVNLGYMKKQKRINREWNLIDENLCKNMNNENCKILLNRHPELIEFIKLYTFNEIIEYYNQFKYINLIQIKEKELKYKLMCLFGEKSYINEEYNIQIELKKENILNRIKKYNIINDIILIIDNKEIDLIKEYIKRYDNYNIEIIPSEKYKKIKGADLIINLSNKKIENFYKKIIKNNNCKIIIDQEFNKFYKWLGIKREDIEKYKIEDNKIHMYL